MKKIVPGLLIFVILLCFCQPVRSAAYSTAAPPGNSASSAILYEAVSGKVLFESGADARKRIASTTKILTALVVLQNCELSEEVEIKPGYTAIEGSSIYLREGEALTIRELLYGLMLESGNDAAVALACYTAGSTQKFAAMMNKEAERLGCKNSNFVNPHGLDAEGHYSSARDLAVITAEAMKNKSFREITATKEITIGTRTFKNHNKLLWTVEGVIGGKTGYTKASGRTLVSCAERGGMTLICVTLTDPDDWTDHTALFEWAASELQCAKINKSDVTMAVLPVISGTKRAVAVHPAYDYAHIGTKSDELTTVVEAPKFVYASVIKGAKAGRVVIKQNGAEVASIPLLYAETVKLDENAALSPWEKIKRAWYISSSYNLQRPSY